MEDFGFRKAGTPGLPMPSCSWGRGTPPVSDTAHCSSLSCPLCPAGLWGQEQPWGSSSSPGCCPVGPCWMLSCSGNISVNGDLGAFVWPVLTWTLCAAECVQTCVGFLGLGFFFSSSQLSFKFGLRARPCCSNSSILQLICFICFPDVLVFPWGNLKAP